MDTRKGLMTRFADRYGVEEAKLFHTLKMTAFRLRNGEPTNEQMMALLVVADQHGLNPFCKEIYAFQDNGGIIPVVGVDGWARIINEHPQFDGMTFAQSEDVVTMSDAKPAPEWIECAMHRKDREHPIVVREYLDECYREPIQKTGKNGKPYTIRGPWQTHTKRFLRHKTMIQCARIAFGFAGIYDPDEAERIQEATTQVEPVPAGRPAYSDEQMEQNLKGFHFAIEKGRSPDDLIAMIESKYELTETQREQIRELAYGVTAE